MRRYLGVQPPRTTSGSSFISLMLPFPTAVGRTKATVNGKPQVCFFFFNELLYLFIYLFIFGCVRSSFLCEGFL